MRGFTPLLPAPPWTYWVDPGRLLAGPYPGDKDLVEHENKLHQLLDAGVESFLCLQEEDELKRFRPYHDNVDHMALSRGFQCQTLVRPIADQGVPSIVEMQAILDAMDEILERSTLYLHCWGGVGRTGTVACCWLLRHGLADRDNVFDRLAELRKVDLFRGWRPSPENETQADFVRAWALRSG